MTTIETDRLLLRPVHTADAVALFPLFADPAVLRWLAGPPMPYTLDDMVAFLDRVTSPDNEDRVTYLVIERQGAAIGGISWRLREADHTQAGAGPHLGFWLGRPSWGHGFMPEAARHVVRHLFTAPAVDAVYDAVYSGAFVGNTPSRRVHDKLGFERTGMTRLRSNPQNADLPLINMRLLRTHFEAIGS
jgi:RimJ/RimL family protein N-acetyltransferase